MTNFTMDELTDLLFCVTDHAGYQGDSIHNNLINKIQSMIDNYCEHTQSTLVNSCLICELTNSYSIREFSEHLCNDCAKTFQEGANK